MVRYPWKYLKFFIIHFFFLISFYVFEAHLDACEGKEEVKVEAKENVEAVSLEATELTFEEMIIERSEEDAEAGSKEVTENVDGEGSFRVMSGILLCQCFNHIVIWYVAHENTLNSLVTGFFLISSSSQEVLQVEIKCLLKQPPSVVYEGREETEDEDEEDFPVVEVDATELTCELVFIEGLEEDVEVVSSEVTEDVSGEVSIHMIPGNLPCRYPNHIAIFGMVQIYTL